MEYPVLNSPVRTDNRQQFRRIGPIPRQVGDAIDRLSRGIQRCGAVGHGQAIKPQGFGEVLTPIPAKLSDAVKRTTASQNGH
jgi:hypothetical protein